MYEPLAHTIAGVASHFLHEECSGKYPCLHAHEHAVDACGLVQKACSGRPVQREQYASESAVHGNASSPSVHVTLEQREHVDGPVASPVAREKPGRHAPHTYPSCRLTCTAHIALLFLVVFSKPANGPYTVPGHLAPSKPPESRFVSLHAHAAGPFLPTGLPASSCRTLCRCTMRL
jgi:hypothetical protein